MHVFITGATGLIGSVLTGKLLEQGHTLTILTRNPAKAARQFPPFVHMISSLDTLESLDDYEAVINLAGEPIIGKRWSVAQKERLCKSRWDITRRLSMLIQTSRIPPAVFISGSAVGYYGAWDEQLLDEQTPAHDGFTNFLCRQWEALALEAQSAKTRVCISRTGIVLSPDGGMLSRLLLPFRLGFGSVLGKGTQYISWIHIHDMINALLHLLNDSDAKGVFNLTAPHPVTNKQFSDTLSLVLHRPRLFRIPTFILYILLGESASMILDGQRVIPKMLTESHFRFTYNMLDDALKDVLKRKG